MLTRETEWWGHRLLLGTLSFPGTQSAHGSAISLATLCQSPFWCLFPTSQQQCVPDSDTSASSLSTSLTFTKFKWTFQTSNLIHTPDSGIQSPTGHFHLDSISHLKINSPKMNHVWTKDQNHQVCPIDSISQIYPKLIMSHHLHHRTLAQATMISHLDSSYSPLSGLLDTILAPNNLIST